MLCALALAVLAEARLTEITTRDVTESAATSDIMARITRNGYGLYAKACVEDEAGGKRCRCFAWERDSSSRVTATDYFARSKGELSFYYAAAFVKQKHREAFTGFVNERCLQGYMTCFYHFNKRGELKRTYGPADAIKMAITDGRVKFISPRSRFEMMTMRHDPESILDLALSITHEQLSSGRLNVVVFPEFFFNRIYQTQAQPLLSTDTVEHVIDKCNEKFGRHPHVILAMCFFHQFDTCSRPLWLTEWIRPPENYTDTACNNERLMTMIREGYDTKIHMANYQLFVWNKKALAVYRKSTYHHEMLLGPRVAPEGQVVDNKVPLYEFGNWRTDLLCQDESLHEGAIAKLLFGAKGMIVPRICSDLTHISCGLTSRPPSFRMFEKQLRYAKFLLVSGAQLPFLRINEVRRQLSPSLRVVAVDNDARVSATSGRNQRDWMHVENITQDHRVPVIPRTSWRCLTFSWTTGNFSRSSNSNSHHKRRWLKEQQSVVPCIKKVSGCLPCDVRRELHFQTLDNECSPFKYYAQQLRDSRLKADVRRLRKLLSRYFRMTTERETMIDAE